MAKKRAEFYTSAQVASILRISESTLRNQRHRGEGLPFYKVGPLVRYRRKDVVDYLRKNVHKPLNKDGKI